MRASSVVCLVAAVCALVVAGAGSADGAETGFAPGRVIVKFTSDATAADCAVIRGELGVTARTQLGLIEAEVLDIANYNVRDAVAAYSGNAKIEYIEPDYDVHAVEIPNDPMFGQLWGLNNTGQTGGTPGADIDAVRAWDIFTGTHDVVIGVIDTGVDYNHPDLTANMWTNPGEIPSDGQDNDGNGYVDDVYGYDFYNGDGDPWDDNRHGTHCSGTIAGVGDNGIGVAGVNWTARIMAVKFLGSGGSGSTSDAILAVEYATMMHAQVLSNSWGGGGYSEALEEAISAAYDAGILFVAAAGNYSSDNDLSPFYPSSYTVPNVVSVLATDHNDYMAGFSNYGATSVDLGAPGDNILSTIPSNSYDYLSGTSMATPHVSGVAALVWGRFPAMSVDNVKTLLLASVDRLPSLAGRCVSGGRLNAFTCISEPDSIPPAAVSDLAAENPGSNTMDLRWTATGDDGLVGTAASYDVRYSISPIDETNFGDATEASGAPDPGPPGTAEWMRVTGLDFETEYYFAVKVRDEYSNYSGVSNIVAGTTLGIPDIAVQPDSLHEELLTGAASSQVLTIYNVGEGTLDFTIPTPTLAFGTSTIQEFLEVPKGGSDARTGGPVVEGRGGPDAWGYRWTDSDEPDGPAFSWVDITGVGTLIPMSGDDANSGPYPIGFDFEFYGNTFDQFRICTNGFMSFTSTSSQFSNQPLPSSGAPENLLAAFWDDLYLSGDRAYYYYDGTRLVVEWYQVNPLGGGAVYTFEVILYPTGEIVYQYLQMDPPADGATVGIQNAAKDDGLEIAFNTSYVHDSLAVSISRLPLWVTVSPTSGRVYQGGLLELAVNFDATGLVGGDYSASVMIESNDPDEPAYSVPVGMRVIGAPDISVSPPSLDFAEVYIGAVKTLAVVVANPGTDSLEIADISSDNPVFDATPKVFTLGPRRSLTVDVSFAPSSIGPAPGMLTLFSNDPDEPAIQVSVLGEGIVPPEISVSPDSLADSLLTGETSSQTLTICNSGGSDLVFEVDIVEERLVDVFPSRSDGAAPGSLPAPPAGPRPDLEPDETAGGPISSAPVAALGETGTSVIFEDDFEDGDYDGWSDGGGSGTKEVTDATAAKGRYSYHEYNSSGSHFRGIYQLFGAIQPGYIGFYIRSGSTATSDAYFVLHDSGGSEVIWFFARQNGFLYVNADVGGDESYRYDAETWYHIEFKDIDFTAQAFDYYVDGELVKENIPFRNAGYVGGFSRLDIYNWSPGSQAWWDEITIATEEPTRWLAVFPTSGVIPAGTCLDLDVTFNAAGLYGGDYLANVVVKSNDVDEPEVAVPAHLNVTGAPDISVSPVSLDYGDVFIGASPSETVEVANDGTDSLVVSDIWTDSGDYGVDVTGFALAPEERRLVTVTFSPSVVGEILGSLTIASNDSDEPSVVVSLRGVGLVPPEIGVSPDSLADSLYTDETSIQWLTIANTGGSDLIFDIAVLPQVVSAGHGGSALDENLAMNGPVREPDDNGMGVVTEPTPPRFSLEAFAALTGSTEILAWNKYSDNGSGGEFENTVNAIAMWFTDFTLEPSAVTDPDSLRMMLVGKDVFLIPEQERAGYDLPAIGASWQGVLADFVAGGGAVVFCDQGESGGEFITNTGLMEVTEVSRYYGNVPLRVVAPDHPLVDGVPEYFTGMNATGVYSIPDETAEAVAVDQSLGRPVVASKEIGRGHVALVGFDFYSYNSDMAHVVANAVQTGSSLRWLSLTPESGVVSPGDSAAIRVMFDATDLYGGDYYATVVVASNDMDEPEVEVPAHLNVTGAPNIVVSPVSLDFGEVFIGTAPAESLIVSNLGTDTLVVSDVWTDNGDYSADVTNFTLAPEGSRLVVVTFSPSVAGEIAGTLEIASNDPDEPLVGVTLRGVGLVPPEIGVSPDSLADSLCSGDTATHYLTISNTGGSNLIWQADLDFAGESAVLEASPRFEGAGPVDQDKGIRSDPSGRPGDDRIYISARAGGMPAAPDVGAGLGASLEDVLVSLEANYGNVTGVIPNRYDFSEGEIGYYIIDGGYDMYDVGNYLSTNLGSSLAYSNGAVVVSPYFGENGRYFTRKYPGLFVLAADMTAVDWFGITGDLGADGMGYTDGAVLETEYLGVTYYGFVKRVYSAYDPSVNHLVIVPENALASHEFSAYTNDDYHRILNLGASDRLYYLLYAGAGGFYIDDVATLAIMNAFLANAGLRPAWLSVTPESGVVAPGDSEEVGVTFDAAGLYGGDYYANIVVTSNDMDEPEVAVPAHLNVTGAPSIVVSPVSLDFGEVFLGASLGESLDVANDGTDSLVVSDIWTDNGDYTVDVTSFTLAPEESRSVVVTFGPSIAGEIPGSLTIASNDPSDAELHIPLSGIGVIPARLEAEPETLAAVSIPGRARTVEFGIGNAGGQDLVYNIHAGILPAAAAGGDGVGEGEPQAGAPGLLGSGGPDAFGHCWIDSDQPGGPDFNWIEISGIGTEVPMSGDDVNKGRYPIGFAFPFYGQSFVNFRVCTNGFVSFSSLSASHYTTPLPSVGAPENLLAILWDDLEVAAGSVFYHYDGTKTVIEFRNASRVGGDGLFTFEVILYPDGEIVYQYLSVEGYAEGATVGIQNAARDDGLQVCHNAPYVHSGLATRIFNAADWVTVTPAEGVITPGGYDDIRVRLDARGMETGLHTAALRIESNDIARPVVYVPIYLEVLNCIPAPLLETTLLVLPMGSDERWVYCDVGLPGEYEPGLVDAASVVMVVNDETVACDPSGFGYEGPGGDGNYVLHFRFDRARIESLMGEGDTMEVEVSGEVTGFGYFSGTETLRLVRPTLGSPYGGEVFTMGEDMEVAWNVPAGTHYDSFALYFSGDGGATWQEMRSGLVGQSATVAVPEVETAAGLVRVYVLVGGEVVGYATSGEAFTINAGVQTPGAGVSDFIPAVFALGQSRPNPFSVTTTIVFDLPRETEVRLDVYDVRGKLVVTLVDDGMPAGRYNVVWNGRDARGVEVSAGVYFYRMRAGGWSDTQRMSLVR